MVKAITNFDPNVRWAGDGVGCLVCTRNVSREGAKHDGLAGVDLEAELDIDGTDKWDGFMGLCWDCAIQVGRAVNMERKADADERLREAEDTLDTAREYALSAAENAAAARLDKDTVVRLLGVDESVPA